VTSNRPASNLTYPVLSTIIATGKRKPVRLESLPYVKIRIGESAQSALDKLQARGNKDAIVYSRWCASNFCGKNRSSKGKITMSRKDKTTKAGLKGSEQQPQPTYPVGEEDLDQQRERLRKAAASGASSLKPAVPAAAATQLATQQTPEPRRLAPVAAAWPGSAPAQGEAKPSSLPAAQKALTTQAAPKVSAPAAAPKVSVPAATKVSVPAATPEIAVGSSPRPQPQKVTPVAQGPAKATSVNVSFALFRPEAHRVSLCGEFNGWSPEAAPMERHENGRWEKTLSLRPGKYQYKFVVDGQWCNDPAARENVPNAHGSLNSVVEARA
jgi:hypothetical protein